MSILNVEHRSHGFGDRAVFEDVSFRLLLDEPTNHLDVDAKEERKRALRAYKGSILLICHEPEFYNDVVPQVWDCAKWTTRIT